MGATELPSQPQPAGAGGQRVASSASAGDAEGKWRLGRGRPAPSAAARGTPMNIAHGSLGHLVGNARTHLQEGGGTRSEGYAVAVARMGATLSTEL